MGPAKFKSTLITEILLQGDKFTFRGRGWGHGVGLCQYGMKGLGELGYSYQDILKYYFPGSEMSVLSQTGAGAIPALLDRPQSWWTKVSDLLSFSPEES